MLIYQGLRDLLLIINKGLDLIEKIRENEIGRIIAFN